MFVKLKNTSRIFWSEITSITSHQARQHAMEGHMPRVDKDDGGDGVPVQCDDMMTDQVGNPATSNNMDLRKRMPTHQMDGHTVDTTTIAHRVKAFISKMMVMPKHPKRRRGTDDDPYDSIELDDMVSKANADKKSGQVRPSNPVCTLLRAFWLSQRSCVVRMSVCCACTLTTMHASGSIWSSRRKNSWSASGANGAPYHSRASRRTKSVWRLGIRLFGSSHPTRDTWRTRSVPVFSPANGSSTTNAHGSTQ